MKTRHLGKALVGLVAAAAAVGLMGLPASANTRNAEITGGTLDIYASDSSNYSTQTLGTGGSTECTTSTNGGSFTVTASTGGNGTFTGSFDSHTYTAIGGVNFTVDLNIVLSGNIDSTGAITNGSGTASALLYTGNCTPGTPVCSIAVGNIDFTGTSTVTGHNIDVSDTATVSGTTGDHGGFLFNVSVTDGSGAGCGALIAVDDGSVTSTNVVVHATS